MMNDIFWDLIVEGIMVVYLDDILIFTRTEEKHVVKDGIPEERKYGIIDRNYTPFRSNVQCRRRIYLAMI